MPGHGYDLYGFFADHYGLAIRERDVKTMIGCRHVKIKPPHAFPEAASQKIIFRVGLYVQSVFFYYEYITEYMIEMHMRVEQMHRMQTVREK